MSGQILRHGEVGAMTGLSRTTIDRLEAQGDFPPRVRLASCAVGWLESEVRDWVRARVAQRDSEVASGADRRAPSGGWRNGTR